MRALAGLAAALFVIAASAPAFAAKDAENAIPPEATAAGMKDAPALIEAAKLPCTMTGAREMGVGTGADKLKVTYYEVSCKEGLGWIIAAKEKTPTPVTYDCVMMGTPGPDGKPNPSRCILPGNASPAAGLTSVVSRAGRQCAVDRARYVGSTSDSGYYEVSCADGVGYVVEWPKDQAKAPIATMCLAFGPQSNIKCELTPADQQTVIIDRLIAASGKACQIKDKRYVGATAEHDDFFEVACADGKGYMIQADATGKLKDAIDCAKAAAIGGGCSMTDTREAETQQNAIYSNLAKKAGFDCTVAKYADFPASSDAVEIVEIACSNRPDGGVGSFPAKGKPTVWDCIRAQTEGYKCSFSQEAAVYPKLTAQLRAKGKPSCAVSNARPYGRTTTGADLVEVACADGGPGWVLEYETGASDPAALLNCAQAAGAGGGGCQLPTNKAH